MFSVFYAIIAIEYGFQCIYISQVPREARGLGFQHLPQDMANVNAWKNKFAPYSV